MLIGITGFAAYGFLAKSDTPKSVYFEADASGRLQQVERPSHSRNLPPALWKPEPQVLTENRTKLKLSRSQLVRIESVSSQWLAKKADLLRRIESEAAEVHDGKTTVAALRSGLGDYAELSRLYDHTRNLYWDLATAELDPRQKTELEKVRLKGARP